MSKINEISKFKLVWVTSLSISFVLFKPQNPKSWTCSNFGKKKISKYGKIGLTNTTKKAKINKRSKIHCVYLIKLTQKSLKKNLFFPKNLLIISCLFFDSPKLKRSLVFIKRKYPNLQRKTFVQGKYVYPLGFLENILRERKTFNLKLTSFSNYCFSYGDFYLNFFPE